MSAAQGWAVVEIMGHRRHVGMISEVQHFGATMLRVDAVVAHDIEVRRPFFYNGSAIFGVSPITEEEAKREVAPYGSRALPPAPPTAAESEEEGLLTQLEADVRTLLANVDGAAPAEQGGAALLVVPRLREVIEELDGLRGEEGDDFFDAPAADPPDPDHDAEQEQG